MAEAKKSKVDALRDRLHDAAGLSSSDDRLSAVLDGLEDIKQLSHVAESLFGPPPLPDHESLAASLSDVFTSTVSFCGFKLLMGLFPPELRSAIKESILQGWRGKVVADISKARAAVAGHKADSPAAVRVADLEKRYFAAMVDVERKVRAGLFDAPDGPEFFSWQGSAASAASGDTKDADPTN